MRKTGVIIVLVGIGIIVVGMLFSEHNQFWYGVIIIKPAYEEYRYPTNAEFETSCNVPDPERSHLNEYMHEFYSTRDAMRKEMNRAAELNIEPDYTHIK